MIVLTGNASPLETSISSIQELENVLQRLRKEFDRVYATQILAPIHLHEVQPKIFNPFISHQTIITKRFANLVPSNAPNCFQLEWKLSVLGWSHPESHQFNVCSIGWLESTNSELILLRYLIIYVIFTL